MDRDQEDDQRIFEAAAAPLTPDPDEGRDAEGGETGGLAALPSAPVPSAPLAGAGRLAALLEVIACSGFPTQIAIAAVLALAGMRPFDAQGRLSPPYVFTLSVVDAIVLTGLVVWFLHLHGERARAVLLGRRPLAREGLLGILQIPVVFLLVIVVMTGIVSIAPSLHNVARNPMEGLIASHTDAWLFVVVAVVSGGLREEVQRAFILHRFEAHLGGAAVGLLVFSVVFGAGHVIQGRDVAVTTAVLGLFWGTVYLRRRSIASTVVSHSGFNTAEILRYFWMGV